MSPPKPQQKQHPSRFRRLLRILIILTLLLPVLLSCLDLTATITRSTPLPILRGRLVDNGKYVCGINLSTRFGSRLPWNCLPGFKAWSTPDGGELTYENGPWKWTLGSIEKSLQADRLTHGNQMTVLRGKWFGCVLEDTWAPAPKERRSEIWERRVEGRIGEGEGEAGAEGEEVIEG